MPRTVQVAPMPILCPGAAAHHNGGSADISRSIGSKQNGTRAGTTNFFATGTVTDKDQANNGARGCTRTLFQEGRLEEALHKLDQGSIPATFHAYFSLLQGCINMNALADGRKVHAHIAKSGLEPSIRLGNVLVDMYAKCGSMSEAQEAFRTMPERNVVTWTMLIAGYVRLGQTREAFKLFLQMEQEGMMPDEITCVSILKACATLKALKQIHSRIIKSAIEPNVFVGNTLIDMYAKCRSVKEALQVFDSMQKRDVISWTVMILGFAQQGHGNEALNLFLKMEFEGMKPNKVTFVGLLKACTSLAVLEKGREIHRSIVKNGLELDNLVENTIIDMYTKCGCIEDAHRMFNRIVNRDVVSWNVMISGYAQHNYDDEAFDVFQLMDGKGVQQDTVTFISVLKACANQASLPRGRWLHACIVRRCFDSDIVVGSTLVDMYTKCGSMENAQRVFDNLVKEDVVPWNAMIAGYAQNGYDKEALQVFSQMQWEGIVPNEVTFASILKACGSLADFREGKRLHAYIMKTGFESDLVVKNTLVDMYAKCGSVENAREVFWTMSTRDTVSWNAMVAGYVQHGHPEEAFKLFWMMQREGMKPNDVTFVSILKACISIAALEQGKQIHSLILDSGIKPNTFIGNTLVHMYAKCGSLEAARQVFEAMPKRDDVSWAVMISNYTEQEQSEEAVRLYWEMEQEGTNANEVIYLAILQACTNMAALEQGKKVHAQLIKHGFFSSVPIENALIDMYAKCGSLENAQDVFDQMLNRDAATWTLMILGFAQHGHGKEALQICGKMLVEDVKLDHVTLVGVLSACSHTGLLCEGRHVFDSMRKDYGISPTADHYACMVDLFGRVGHLEEAMDLVEKMPFQPNSLVWTALLSACRRHGNVKLAKPVAESILELEPNTGALVTLSNIYAAEGPQRTASDSWRMQWL